MTNPFSLFEVSWEVCNKVGGIHTVLSSKARTAVERLGDDYVAIGPWLLSDQIAEPPLDDVDGYEDFVEACRADGVPVRVGRWQIPGRPLTVLVAFSGLYAAKDGILAGLWERHGVDSLTGQWDYVEPVLFGQAAGIAIRHWYARDPHGPDHMSVAQFHEWLTASGLLYLRDGEPSIGTVFTTHATVLGRAVASRGIAPTDALLGRSMEALADELGVRAKHSLESAAIRDADVFTTVSEITAREAALIHGRDAEPVLPNGIDLDVIADQIGDVSREEAAARLRAIADRFLGHDTSAASMICVSGRYEFHNKGIDVLLDALSAINAKPGRPLVLWVLSPAGNSGVQGALLDRLARRDEPADGPLGISTHNLFDPARDPVHARAAELGLDNRTDARVKVIQVPVYLRTGDGLLDLPYEAVIQAMDLTCFPSFYEPWGYTPLESLAVGVPTVTSDSAGFGQWCLGEDLGPGDGVHVLARADVGDGEVVSSLAAIIEGVLAAPPDAAHIAARCRAVAARTSWSELIRNYEEAYGMALDLARTRADRRPPGAWQAGATVPLPLTSERRRPNLETFDVYAALPKPLEGLASLTGNYWWTWDADAGALFAELSPELWEACGHNPVMSLRQASAENLSRAAGDATYVRRLREVLARFKAYLADGGRWRSPDGTAGPSVERPIAYFCAEFGIHESLPIYGGGLGILAGDHLKSASDIGLPLVAVGLFYRNGYVAQQLSGAGDQLTREFAVNPLEHPLRPVVGHGDEPLEIAISTPGGALAVRAWRTDVGRVPLYLLDTNVPRNRPEDRAITSNLYGGGPELRLQQEIVLGKGGERLLQVLGIQPSVYHLNEGHAALVPLERVSHLVRQQGLTFEEARELVRATTVFTTHTAVPAGHDRFGEDLMRRHFSDAPLWIGVPWERFFALGQSEAEPGSFNMTGLAINFSGRVNAVSDDHRRVSQALLHQFWSSLLQNEVPVHAITNGVHLPSWASAEIRAAMGVDSRALTGDDFVAAGEASDAALWDAMTAARRRLLAEVSRRLTQRSVERFDSPRLLGRMLDGLAEDAMIVGFARRFAPYKRADLLFTNPDRLAKILGREDRPVRVLFAGLAHPNDGLGKDLLRRIFELTRSEPFVGRVFFVEGYDIELARLLVQGSDVWLNTPIHGLEASGTSGMKAAANGALNVSILDGWWTEASDGGNGWAIGGARVYDRQDLQDELDAAALYRLLSDTLIPLFYDRDDAGLPHRWLERVRHSLATIPPEFNTDRMVRQYVLEAYAPMAADMARLEADRYSALRNYAQRADAKRTAFPDVHVRKAEITRPYGRQAGQRILAHAEVALGPLAPEDVTVELVVGSADGPSALGDMAVVPLRPVSAAEDGAWTFEGQHIVAQAGRFAYGIRVRPCCEGLLDPQMSDLVAWA